MCWSVVEDKKKCSSDLSCVIFQAKIHFLDPLFPFKYRAQFAFVLPDEVLDIVGWLDKRQFLEDSLGSGKSCYSYFSLDIL